MKAQSDKLRNTVWDLAKLNEAYADTYKSGQWAELYSIAEERRILLEKLQLEGKI